MAQFKVQMRPSLDCEAVDLVHLVSYRVCHEFVRIDFFRYCCHHLLLVASLYVLAALRLDEAFELVVLHNLSKSSLMGNIDLLLLVLYVLH